MAAGWKEEEEISLVDYLCLEGAKHANDKRIVGKGHDVPLRENLLHLISQHQVQLIDLLHGKPLIRLLVPDQVNRSVRRMDENRENRR